jgi:hypothetical protein
MVFKYEDIIGNEREVFGQIFKHYKLPIHQRVVGCALADKYSVKKRKKGMKHIRNPAPGQWREHFTPKVSSYFNELYGHLIERYDYDL